MSLKKEIRNKLAAAEFDQVFDILSRTFESSSEEYNTLTITQANYHSLQQDFLRNVILRNEYDVNLARIANTLMELLQRLPDDPKDKKSAIKTLIRRLDIEKSRIGLLYMVNCNRKNLADMFWDRFDEQGGNPYQFYFIPACPVQMPPSFAERMTWEVLLEELDEEVEALSIEMKSNGLRLKTADFTIKNSLERTQKAFKKYFCKRFQEPDFDKLITHVLPQKGYRYIATIIRIELNEWKPFMPEFLEWALETFGNASRKGEVSFLFFNVIYMQDFINDPIDEEQKRILVSLRNIINKNNDTCTVLKGLAPVPNNDLEYWFREIGERNPNRVAEVIQAMVDCLPSHKKQRFLKEQQLDMADIEDLQEIVYEVANE